LILQVWDLKDAGLQATTRVAQASNPLHLLMDISQNFPSIVSSLTKQPVSSKLRKQVSATQELVNAGSNFMMLNGLMVEVNNFELYSK
jgi:UDP-glucose:glycoprotein glucosyltransferase